MIKILRPLSSIIIAMETNSKGRPTTVNLTYTKKDQKTRKKHEKKKKTKERKKHGKGKLRTNDICSEHRFVVGQHQPKKKTIYNKRLEVKSGSVPWRVLHGQIGTREAVSICTPVYGKDDK